jgi:hypothetical protein
MEVMGRSFKSGFESDECRYVQDGRAIAFVTGRMKFFGETTSGLIRRVPHPRVRRSNAGPVRAKSRTIRLEKITTRTG